MSWPIEIWQIVGIVGPERRPWRQSSGLPLRRLASGLGQWDSPGEMFAS